MEPETDPTPHETAAAHPFDDEDADVILRTSDNVTFHVHKYILSLMSPVFRSMFSLPQVQGDTHSKPVIEIPEDSRPTLLVLTLCDPRATSGFIEPESPMDITRALLMADKYDMPEVIRAVEEKLRFSQLIKNEPARIYAVSTRFNLQNCARIAARNVLRQPFLISSGYASCPEFSDTSGAAINNLYTYTLRCRQAAMDAIRISDLKTFSPALAPLARELGDSFWKASSCCIQYLQDELPKRLSEKIDGSAIDASLMNDMLMHVARHSFIPYSPETSAKIPVFVEKVSKLIDDEISKVQLQFD